MDVRLLAFWGGALLAAPVFGSKSAPVSPLQGEDVSKGIKKGREILSSQNFWKGGLVEASKKGRSDSEVATRPVGDIPSRKIENECAAVLKLLKELRELGESESIEGIQQSIEVLEEKCDALLEQKQQVGFSQKVREQIDEISQIFKKHKGLQWVDLCSDLYIAVCPLFEDEYEKNSEVDDVENFWNQAYASGCIQRGGGAFKYQNEEVFVEKK